MAAGNLLIENYDPYTRDNKGIRTKKGLVIAGGAVDFTGASSVSLGAISTTAQAITSASANAFSVGPGGTTNPIFNVDASTASAVAGLNLKGAATGGTVAVATIDSGSANNLTVDALGTGTVGIATVSTGTLTLGGSAAVTLAGSTTVATGKTFNTTDGAALQEGGVIIPRYEFVTYAQGGQSATQYTNTNGSVSLYVNDTTSGTYKVVAASASFATAGGASCAVTVEVCTGTQAPGSGTAQLTGTLALTGTANTAVNGTIIGSPTTIAAGNRMGVVFSGTNTGLANCVVNVVLQRLT